MTYQGLMYFLAVYDERSITAAAKKLYISQQNLSAHLKRLEEECGCALFERRPVFSPTPAAERLEKTARKILRMQKEVLSEIHDIAANKIGRISVGFSSYMCEEYGLPILKEFYRRYSGVNISTAVDLSRNLEQMTLDGKMDLFFSIYPPRSPILDCETLFELPLTVIVRKQTLERSLGCTQEDLEYWMKNGIRLEHLGVLPLILPCQGWRIREILDNYFDTHSFSPNILLETQHNLSYEMSSEGFGASISCFAVKLGEDSVENPLLRFPVQDIDYVLRPNICRRKDHYMTSWEQSFLEVAHEYFGK